MCKELQLKLFSLFLLFFVQKSTLNFTFPRRQKNLFFIDLPRQLDGNFQEVRKLSTINKADKGKVSENANNQALITTITVIMAVKNLNTYFYVATFPEILALCLSCSFALHFAVSFLEHHAKPQSHLYKLSLGLKLPLRLPTRLPVHSVTTSLQRYLFMHMKCVYSVGLWTKVTEIS